MHDILPFPADARTLANGLKTLVMPMPGNGLVAFWSIVRTGSRDEHEPGRTGFAHFFEHMMFRGTRRYPADVYQRILTEIGADANAYTTDDHTAYHVSMAAEDLETVIELESDRFQHLEYAEADFQTEAGAVYGEYRKVRTDPMFTLYEALLAEAFKRHTYGHTTMGFERDIAAMPTLFDYSREFFARYYRPDNTVLFAAGDVDSERVHALVERHYGGWQPGYTPPAVPREPEQTSERRIRVTYDGRTLPVLWNAYKIGAFDPRDRVRVAADLLADLAFGETSEAYRQLVLDEQVVEFLDAQTGMNRDPSLLDVYARVKSPRRLRYVQNVIDVTVARYQDAPPDEARLTALKSRLKYGFVMDLQTPDDVAQELAEFIGLTGDLDGVRALYSTYDEVTPADVQAAAQRYLVAERRTVGILEAKRA